MSKEDLKKYREELDRKETAKMMKAINEQNKRKKQERLLEEAKQEAARKKQEKKDERINFALIVVMFLTLLTLFVAMIVYLEKDNEEFMHECTTAGYSENYCRTQL